MGKFHVNNYDEYIRKLKQTFEYLEEMPSSLEIQSFISKYSLYVDWEIEVNEVKYDIELLFFGGQYERWARKKRVQSYKEYLDVLKIEFGIPQRIPPKNDIQLFISKYKLKEDWGITEKEIRKDFKCIIDGKYDDMYKDAIQDAKKIIGKTVKKPYVSKRVTNNNMHTYSRYMPKKEASIVRNETGGSCSYDKRINEEKSNSELELTIIIDGDNHIHKAEEGIENTTKDTMVESYFVQPGAKKKFDLRHEEMENVSSQVVEPGNQAVDNAIMARVDEIIKKDEKQIVAIVSEDKGFEGYAKGKDNVYVAKSVQEAMDKANQGRSGKL